MTWEIALGLFAIVSTFLGVMKVAVRVNRTLTLLESAVNRLSEHIERQARKNEKIFKQLGNHERRIAKIENFGITFTKGRNTNL
ncbi:MAG TPA: hypothetical protein GX011_00325 [Clostridiales bacterium]|nr:hypothetical protein [Clostridiales bacterium]